MYGLKNKSPRMEPCGTPIAHDFSDDKFVFYSNTLWGRRWNHPTQFTVLVEGLNLIGFARTTGWLSVLSAFYKSRDAAPTTPSVIPLHNLQETCTFIWIDIAKAKPHWIQQKELISPCQVFDRFDRVSSEISRKQILTGTNFLFTGLRAFLNIAQGRSGTLAATKRPSLVWGSPARPAVLTLIDRV